MGVSTELGALGCAVCLSDATAQENQCGTNAACCSDCRALKLWSTERELPQVADV